MAQNFDQFPSQHLLFLETTRHSVPIVFVGCSRSALSNDSLLLYSMLLEGHRSEALSAFILIHELVYMYKGK